MIKLFYHILVNELGMLTPLTDVAVLVAVPAWWSRSLRMRLQRVLLCPELSREQSSQMFKKSQPSEIQKNLNATQEHRQSNVDKHDSLDESSHKVPGDEGPIPMDTGDKKELENNFDKNESNQFSGIWGVYIIDAPICASLACAAQSALVIDVGHAGTSVSIVIEGEVPPGASFWVPGSGAAFLDEAIMKATGVSSLTEARLLREAVTSVKASVSSQINSGDSQVANEILENISSPVPEETTSVTASMLGEMIREAICAAAKEISQAVAVMVTQRCDPEKRGTILEHVILTGGGSRLDDFKAEILADISRRLLSVSTFQADSQPRSLKTISVPTYYPDIWEAATPLATWFGAGIVAKCVLGDSKVLVTRSDISGASPNMGAVGTTTPLSNVTGTRRTSSHHSIK